MEEAERIIAHLVGEQIVSGEVTKDGIHLITRNGLVIVMTVCEGYPVLGVLQTEETVHH